MRTHCTTKKRARIFWVPFLVFFFLEFRLVKLATVVEGDQKTPFSIATTPRCRRGHNSFPWIGPLYPWYVPFITECLTRRYQVQFLNSLVWRNLGINPGLPDHWWTLYLLEKWAFFCPNALTNGNTLCSGQYLTDQSDVFWSTNFFDKITAPRPVQSDKKDLA